MRGQGNDLTHLQPVLLFKGFQSGDLLMPLYASGAPFKVGWINPPEPFRRRCLIILPKSSLDLPAFVGSFCDGSDAV
jgi:hypothetical protein